MNNPAYAGKTSFLSVYAKPYLQTTLLKLFLLQAV